MTSGLTVGFVEASPRSRLDNRPTVYLPYATAMLEAYARHHATRSLRFLPAIAWRVRLAQAVEQLQDADVIGFSTYVWNSQYSLELARLLKQQRRDRVIVFGGPHVPDRSEDFLRANPFVDVACHGEGEKVFWDVLDRADSRDRSGIASISYIDRDGSYVRNPRRQRATDLDEFPSPFLEGIFNRLLEANRNVAWQSIWETNRGCPFSCTFCDWGSATASKVYRFGMERLEREIDWLLRNSINHIFIADANFAILPRDVEIARVIVDAAGRHNARLHLGVQFTKNASDRSAEVQRIFQRSGRIVFEPVVAIQSIDRPTLVAIKRDNISLDAFEEVHRRARGEGIATYTDVIIGLPGETYETFADGISELIRRGQHHRLVIYPCQALPNAEMANAEYRKKYGLECVLLPLNPPPRPGVASPFPEEYIETVIATKAMPKPDWARARVFAWMTQFLYCGRILQLPIMTLAVVFQIGYRRMIEAFATADAKRFPLAGRVATEMKEMAGAMQAGRHEFIYSEELLGLWWSPEVHALAWIVAEGKLQAFFEEAEQILEMACAQEGVRVDGRMLAEALLLNREMLVQPGTAAEVYLDLSYDFLSFHQQVERAGKATLQARRVRYAIRRGGERTRGVHGWLGYLAASELRHRLGHAQELTAGCRDRLSEEVA